MLKRLCLSLLVAFFATSMQSAFAQVTTSAISGFVRADNGEGVVGASVSALHVPTGTTYSTITKTGGRYDLNNLNPGGPYRLTITHVAFQSLSREDVFLTLGETSSQDFSLTPGNTEMSTVLVATTARGRTGGGVETNIGRDRVNNLPTVGRNITDLLRTVPQTRLTSTEGAISIAGQNNRYNAFYIDGALNNDVFGLAASGTNGGQANIPPISLDAIDQIQVSISPYDASLSGFTGGGINAITRSGTNDLSGSVYYLLRNQDLAGKTPTGNKSAATKLPKFSDKTVGFRVGGPIVKNKAFFFVNAEIVRFERPQVFDVSRYGGNTDLAGLLALADTLRKRYGYEPGGFINNPEEVEANRIVTKIDWNINPKNRLSFTYRWNQGERFNVSSSSTSRINFYNNGYRFPTESHTFTGELRSNFGKGRSNRLLLTFADVSDDRDPIGSPFPRVTINDPSTSFQIVFGPDNSSTVNLLTQKNFNLLDIYRFTIGKHSLSVGTDNELNSVYNAFIQNTFGNYTYNSLADFYNNAQPASYSVGYSLVDDKTDENTRAAAKFKTLRMALFVNDEFKLNQNLTINLALRADKFTFLTKPAADTFTNNTAIPIFSQYWDLKGARSGQRPSIPVSISPRVGITYRIPEQKITIRAGAGYFTGRIPLVWPGGIYNNNGIFQGGFTASSSSNAAALNTIRFRPDPFDQWRASDVGITISKGGLNLISKEFKLPKVFRTSLGIDKQLNKGWKLTLEGIFTKNVNEIYYTNINILPPVGTSLGPGPRSVYPTPLNIPISGGSNPYDNAILLSNADGNKGYSYNITTTVDKRFSDGFSFNLNYSYGSSTVIHEQTSSVNLSQWRFIETVNGRNAVTRSTSDFSPGHRIFGFVSKKFTYLNNKLSTTVSLVYTGQSGLPFSYVYGQGSSTNPGPVRDDPSGGNDLFYVPTADDIQTYLANAQIVSNTVAGVTYTPEQQAEALENFIQSNDYLNKRRGQFTERNGDRLPFTNILDLRIAQDFNLKVAGKTYQLQVTYDVFNFTNMLNRKWGRTYFLNNDNFAVMTFAGYVNAQSNLTPTYRFNPTLAQPQSVSNVSTSSAPSFSPRWTSQLGVRINF